MRRIQILFIVLGFLIAPSGAQSAIWELSESVMLRNGMTQRFSIAYPAGWHVTNNRGDISISELPQDGEHAASGPFATEGYLITFRRSAVLEMRQLGIRAPDTTLREAVNLLGLARGYATNVPIQPTTLLGWNALRLRTTDHLGNHIVTLVGYMDIVLMELSLFAPSAETLDTFLPAWDDILEKITVQRGYVMVDNYFIHFECEGAGNPTVILERNWGASLSVWQSVIQEVAAVTQVCSVHRMPEWGLAAQQHVYDLHRVLDLLSIAPPYVLVGHGYGGVTSRIFAGQYPDSVAALLLVESAHENTLRRLREVLSPQALAVMEEQEDPIWQDSLAQMATVRSLGQLPLVVMTAEYNGYPSSDPVAAELETVFQPVWIHELQADLATLSASGRQVVVEGANYMTIIEDPLVAATIQELVALVRKQTQ